jgi:hypothetical protein
LCTPLPLIRFKIRDRKRKKAEFIAALETRLAGLRTQPPLRTDFLKEMRRFLPPPSSATRSPRSRTGAF